MRTAKAKTIINCAKIIPETSKVNVTKFFSINFPSKVLLKKISRMQPMAMGEMIIGISNRVSIIFFPGKVILEIAIAVGIAAAVASSEAIVAVIRLNLMANIISLEKSRD